MASAESAAAPEDLTERLATLILDVFTVEELQQCRGRLSVATDGLRAGAERLPQPASPMRNPKPAERRLAESASRSWRVQTELTERFSISRNWRTPCFRATERYGNGTAEVAHVLNLLRRDR